MILFRNRDSAFVVRTFILNSMSYYSHSGPRSSWNSGLSFNAPRRQIRAPSCQGWSSPPGSSFFSESVYRKALQLLDTSLQDLRSLMIAPGSRLVARAIFDHSRDEPSVGLNMELVLSLHLTERARRFRYICNEIIIGMEKSSRIKDRLCLIHVIVVARNLVVTSVESL